MPRAAGKRKTMSPRRETKQERRKRVMRNRLILAVVLLCLIILVVVLIVACSNKKKEEPAPESGPEIETQTPEVPTEPETKETIKNEKPVHIYVMNYADKVCERTNHISRNWTDEEDLESFGAYCSEENSFPFDTETQAHKDTWNRVKTDTEYKIGYELEFDVNGDHKVITIRKPGDIETNKDLYNGDYPEDGDYSGITGYMGVWVYDDLHQDGEFYIHITQAEVTDETLLTSIKLRPTPQSDAVENLKLRAFSYSSEDEFDADGHYIGQYADEVTIDRE